MQRLFDFLKKPVQLSEKDIAAQVGLGVVAPDDSDVGTLYRIAGLAWGPLRCCWQSIIASPHSLTMCATGQGRGCRLQA